jgi:hypothetical protein
MVLGSTPWRGRGHPRILWERHSTAATVPIVRAEGRIDVNVGYFQLAGSQLDANCQQQRDCFQHELGYLPSDDHDHPTRADTIGAKAYLISPVHHR